MCRLSVQLCLVYQFCFSFKEPVGTSSSRRDILYTRALYLEEAAFRQQKGATSLRFV